MESKNKIVILLLLLFATLNAQESGIHQMVYESNYLTDSSIVRNYDNQYSVVMTYGHFENSPSENGLIERSSFILRDNTNGDLKHLVTLPIGYRVHDVKFVPLVRISGGTDWYCCFCGTHYEYQDIYAIVNPDNGSTQYYYEYDTSGFVGFFKMQEALAPNSTYTAKIRHVEGTTELFQMTCYAEHKGMYFTEQRKYLDNAVLDIIGIPEYSRGAPSCLCRVKFYPVVPVSATASGIRWDNNIRYDFDGQEVLEDIVGTDKYVVTISRMLDDNSKILLRFSDKETSLVMWGLELNHHTRAMKLNTLAIGEAFLPDGDDTFFESPLKLSTVYGDEIATAFKIMNHPDEREGLLTFRHAHGDSLLDLSGKFDSGTFGLSGLLYLPGNDVTAMLLHGHGQRTKYTNMNYWSPVSNYRRLFYVNDIILQSFCHYTTSNEYLLWSGIHGEEILPPYLLLQRSPGYLEKFSTCQNYTESWSEEAKISIEMETHHFPIRERFNDILEEFPVYFIHFNPYEIDLDKKCLIEK